MKTVVITGSTRGLGFEMAKRFRLNGLNVVVNGVNRERLNDAVAKLRGEPGIGAVEGFAGSVASEIDIDALMAFGREKFGTVDIWINNAGVNQPMKAIWEIGRAHV